MDKLEGLLKNQKITSYSGNSSRVATEVFRPANRKELISILNYATDLHSKNRDVSVTWRSTGRSFGGQAIPPSSSKHKILVSLESFEKVIRIESGSAPGPGSASHLVSARAGQLTVRVGAGVTFNELIQYVRRETGKNYICYSMPTSGNISIGGALAANAHSRESFWAGYFPDQVRGFSLLTPRGKNFQCSGKENGSLFKSVPGGFGFSGVASDIQLELMDLGMVDSVDTRVIAKTSSLDNFIDLYTEGERANRELIKRKGFQSGFNCGYIAILFGNPSRGESIILGSKYSCSESERKSARFRPFPIYHRGMGQKILYSIGCLFPRVANNPVFDSFKKPGTVFRNTLDDYKWFQETHESYGRPIVHEAFYIPDQPECLKYFMVSLGKYISSDKYRKVSHALLLQDILWLPPSSTVLSPNPNQSGFYLYTLTFSIGRSVEAKKLSQSLLIDFVEEVKRMGIKVYLLKEAFADPVSLREMYHLQIEQMSALKRMYDPDRIIGSEMLDLLGI